MVDAFGQRIGNDSFDLLKSGIEQIETARYQGANDLQFGRSTGLLSYVINRYDASFNGGRLFHTSPISTPYFTRYFLLPFLKLK